jgi:hypothetical protein
MDIRLNNFIACFIDNLKVNRNQFELNSHHPDVFYNMEPNLATIIISFLKLLYNEVQLQTKIKRDIDIRLNNFIACLIDNLKVNLNQFELNSHHPDVFYNMEPN